MDWGYMEEGLEWGYGGGANGRGCMEKGGVAGVHGRGGGLGVYGRGVSKL